MEHGWAMTRLLERATLNRLASDAGLIVNGVATAEAFDVASDYVVDHIQRGHLAGLPWFSAERARESGDPRTLHSAVQSIVSVAVPFWSGTLEPPDDALRGRVARYAWGRDYHKTLKRRMKTLLAMIQEHTGLDIETRELVDTARAFDRAIAERAGVGWFGKNSMIIVPGHGSWVMLGEMYLDIEIEPDLQLRQNCGRCSICIDNCPTGAIVEPYRIDSPRCISFLTIEERGSIARELRPLMGNWVFGCDVCQDVCPYTGAARVVDDPDFSPEHPDNAFPELEFLARMSEAEFRERFSGTAVTRAKRKGMARNAAIALGNSGDERAIPILETMLHSHDEPLARGHAAWALGHLTGQDALQALRDAYARELEPDVRGEIEWAMEHDTSAAMPSQPLRFIRLNEAL
jgi:epoxyqueuosine reductase